MAALTVERKTYKGGFRMNEKEDLNKLIVSRMGGINKKIMVMSGKGGVGKTTFAVNLSFALQMNGLKTGILDADLHGPNVPKMLGLDDVTLETKDDNIVPAKIPVGLDRQLKVMSIAFLIRRDDPVIWRGPLKINALQQFLGKVEWGELDYLVIDLPPGTGDEPLSIAQLIPDIHGSVIVTTPQDVALADSRRSVNFSKKLGIKVLGIVENMSGFVCPKCGEKTDLFKMGGGEKAAKDLGVPFLGRIPIDPNIVQDSDVGKPFILSHKESDASRSIRDIIDKIKK
ncbi:MAG: ATP-binding protein [Candidatus Altiarchaeales archaeon ex4484_2]|nr:MAG: ATP-binding protein [Candidatus Altiarchaeales archaeon ex4484_2]